MDILEAREEFVKLSIDNQIAPSSFVKIQSSNKAYIAQVIKCNQTIQGVVAYAKILYCYEGQLTAYDGLPPETDANVEIFTKEMLNLLSSQVKTPIILGKTFGGEFNIIADADSFNEKTLICTDNNVNKNLIVQNLVKQFNNAQKQVVILDLLGTIKAKKYVAGKDFKLPLNTSALTFMYNYCLNDVTGDSKSLISEIFKDLSDYSETVEFLPFKTLKNIVDDMVDKSHIFKLLAFKNKLTQFFNQGYFANNTKELQSIDCILKPQCVIIDLSRLDTPFLNQFLNYIYSKLSPNTQVFLEISNKISKKSIKDIFSFENIPTAFLAHSGFKYIREMQPFFRNFIVEPSLRNNEIFKHPLLKEMKKNEYLIYGNALNGIGLVSELTKILEIAEINKTSASQNNYLEQQENTVDNNNTDTNSSEKPIEINDDNTISQNLNYTNDTHLSEIESDIDKRSNSVIEEVVSSCQMPETMIMFEDEEEDKNTADEIVKNKIEESNELTKPEDEELSACSELISEEIVELKEDDLQEPVQTEINTIFDSQRDNIQDNNYSTEVHEADISEEYIDISGYEELNLTDSEENSAESSELIEPIEEVNIKHSDANNDVTELNDNELTEVNTPLEEVPNEALLEEQDNNVVEDFINDNTPQEELHINDNELLDENFIEELQENDNANSKNNLLEDDKNIQQDFLEPMEELDSTDDFIELTSDDIDENDIIIDISDDNLEEKEEENNDDVDSEIIQDVDKVYTTRREDDISDSDLDLIDELNSEVDSELLEISVDNDDELLQELDENENDTLDADSEPTESLEEISDAGEILETRSANTPIVPVYGAEIPPEDIVESDPIEQGDTVIHAKHGVGVVEKMVKYGNKQLYSINFENKGRRVLDPTLTEIKKA